MINAINIVDNVMGGVAILVISSAIAAGAVAGADNKRWRADLSDQLWYEHQCRIVSVSQVKENGPRVEASVRCSDKRLLRVRKSVSSTFSVKDCGKTANC